MMIKRYLFFYFRGQVERPTKRGKKISFRWVDGWSEKSPNGGILYPWMTRKECQAEAKRQGAIARFIRRGVQ